MLIRFRVRNYLSFKEEIELSMVAGKVHKHPEQVIYHSSRSGVDLLRGAMIYGANASGKSNLVKAIAFARFMIIQGVRAKASIPRKPFKLDPDFSNQPSRFEFELQYKGKIYVYGFSLDSEQIIEEWLYQVRSTSEKMLFRRTALPDESNQVDIGIKVGKKDKDLLALIALGTPPNRLYLQECIERNIKHFADVYEWFDKVLLIVFPETSNALAPIGLGNENEFEKFLVKYLDIFDIGVCGYSLQPVLEPLNEIPKPIIEDLEQSKGTMGATVMGPDKQRFFVKREAEQLMFYKLLLRHRDKSCATDVFFDVDEESDGTLRLLDLIPLLYSHNDKKDGVIIIDELDRSLHPNLSYEFISAFLKTTNQKQMIVTTHESCLLDLTLIRRDEVWFVEKDQYGSSSVYSLEEFSPRYDKDIRKGYMMGRFGAIPMIGQPNLMGE